MPEEFKIKKATIHFIYSFFPTTNEVTLKPDTMKRMCEIIKRDERLFCDTGMPPERIGISSYLALKLDMGYIKFPELTGTVDDIEVSVSPLVRIFPLGSSCCISVSASKKINTLDNSKNTDLKIDDVHNLLHLCSQLRNEKAEKSITDIKGDYKTELGEDRITLYQLFKYIINQVVEQYNSDKNESEDKNKMKLLCQEELLTGPEEPHCPWVITSLELPSGDALSSFCGTFSGSADPYVDKIKAIQKYESVIAPLLFRSVYGSDFHLEPAYIPSSNSAGKIGLFNINLDARLFVHMSRRSILCICEDLGPVPIKIHPAKYFLPTLLSLCEMAHTRWQTLVILNRILDKNLKNFIDKSISAKERLNRMVSFINKLTSCLEDPATYVVSGDALREIHEKLMDMYRLENLRETVLKKMELLEKVYQHGIELAWTE